MASAETIDLQKSETLRPLPLQIEDENQDELLLEPGSDFISDEIAVPVTPHYNTFKKLEVVNSRQINSMTIMYNLVTFIAFMLSAIVIVFSRTIFKITVDHFRPEFSNQLTFFVFPAFFDIIDSILSIFVFSYSWILLISFSLIVISLQRRDQLLNEQIWVIMLLVASVLYLNPYEGIIRFRAAVFKVPPPTINLNNRINYIYVLTTVRILSFTVIYVLYLWMGTHSYRLLGKRVSTKDAKFYLFKIFVCTAYAIYKIVILFVFQIAFSDYPLMTAIAFFRLSSATSVWPKISVVTVSILTTFELLILATIISSIWKTSKILGNADYTKHRTKILGFRFFLHQQVVFNIIYLIVYLFLLLALPIGSQITQFSLHNSAEDYSGRGSYYDVLYVPFGLQLCILAFITVEAYTNIPADVNPVRAFQSFITFQKYEQHHAHNPFVEGHDKSPSQPVVYRNREPPSLRSDDSFQIIPNCFIMQTNIQLFNLSWFVYYHGTAKEDSLPVSLGSQGLNITNCLHDSTTDTKAIVAESEDRIIFAFKGTTSTQNLVTDIKVNLRPLSYVLSNDEDSGHSADKELSNKINEGRRERLSEVPVDCNAYDFDKNSKRFRNDIKISLKQYMASKECKRARVHSGFANAYRSIQNQVIEISRSLLKEKNRPICFTGHSLGGALATLSSLDVKLKLGLDSKSLIVSSFGSPRVGNHSFQKLYDDAVHNHWRFVAGGDLISRLPKIGYSHVGKEVFLTSTGELFIDPSVLEILLWHSQSASIIHHRKACYLLALKAWCDSKGEFVPNIWPFPVSENDERKFDSTFKKQNNGTFKMSSSFLFGTEKPHSSSVKSFQDQHSRANRMQKYADDIDALADVSPHPLSSNLIRNWERLIVKGMKRDKASSH